MISYLLYSKLVYNLKLDANGSFLLETFILTFIFVSVWCYIFWDDKELRKKYPGLIYVPEPWSVYSLHYKHIWNIF